MAGQGFPAPRWASPRGYGCWHGSALGHRFPCTGPKLNPLAARRVHRRPTVATMRMALPRQGSAACRSCRPRGHSISSTFSLFSPVQAKSSEANSSLAPPAEARTQVSPTTAPSCGRGHVLAASTCRASQDGAKCSDGACRKLCTFAPNLMKNLVISSASLSHKAP